jgi:hypothetical protein
VNMIFTSTDPTWTTHFRDNRKCRSNGRTKQTKGYEGTHLYDVTPSRLMLNSFHSSVQGNNSFLQEG